jgi:hypothetical protein
MNAHTLHSAILSAAAVAPEYNPRDELHSALCASARYCDVYLSTDWAPENLEERTFNRCERLTAETQDAHEWARAQALQETASEYWHAAGDLPPKFVTFQTSARGRMRVCNTRARLVEFAKQVKANQRAFGGGIAPTKKAKPAQTWNANAIKVVREAMQERQYADALQLAEEKTGAYFYQSTGPTASMLLLIAPIDVPELPGLVTALRANDGAWVVMDTGSGATVGASGGSRAMAIRNAQHSMEMRKVSVDSIAAAIARAQKVDQTKARADFVAHFGIVDEDEAGRLAAEAVAHAQATAAEECASEEFATA